MWFGLAATLTPRRAHRPPPLPAHGTDEPVGVALAQQGVTQQALRGEEELLKRGAHVRLPRA